ncbi:MAG: hypothetical protein ABR558_06965 [Thioalkalivibrio sp.]
MWLALVFLLALWTLGGKAQAAEALPDHGSLTLVTLALNQDLAREHARGQQILRANRAADRADSRFSLSPTKPRSQATLYPAGDGGVMVEMNFHY